MAKVVAGNWKMHHGPRETDRFFARFRPNVPEGAVQILFFPPDVSLGVARKAAKVTAHFGVQNIHWEPRGALTGEISAEMAVTAGASTVLIGHSERRHVFGETDAEVARKVAAAARAGLTPVVCVGELLDERRAGNLEQVLRRQITAVAATLERCERYMIAYEPVWAIGTGETATPEDAWGAHAIVRAALGSLGDCPILYGGSVKPSNAQGLMRMPDIDGVLVGGASLDAETFSRIVEAGVAC